jgi:hypothetical protein
VDSRLVQHLLSSPLNDGGQWDMFSALVAKYERAHHCVRDTAGPQGLWPLILDLNEPATHQVVATVG